MNFLYNLKIIYTFSTILLLVCNKNDKINRVPVEQINNDSSNNYRYIFRESIKKDKLKEKKKETTLKIEEFTR